MKGNLNSSPCLVLNADYQPLSYFPLSLWGWQETIKAVFLNRVNIVAEYDISVNSSSFSMKLPSVISLKKFIPIRKNRDINTLFKKLEAIFSPFIQKHSCFPKNCL